MKEGWEIKKFEELIQVNQIGLIKSTKEQGNDKPFRYLKMDSITSDNTLVHDKYVFVDATKDEINKFSLNDGDFLFNTRNSYELVGKTCVFRPIDDEPTLFNNNIMRVVFKKGILSRFINYAFSSEQVKERIQRLKSGTTSVVGIYYNGLRNLEIPLPPIPEQQRIVSILDEAFAAIAKAKANAEQNLKNAKELFESYLQGVFEKKGDGWEERKVNEIGNAQTGTTPKTAEKENYGDFIPFVKPADVDFSGIGDIRYDNEGLSEIGLKKGRKMESGSILMVCIGATIGKVGFAEREVSCNQQINSLTVKKEFEPKFIYYAMTSKEFKEKVLLEGKGAQATLPIINKSKWENLTISFPKSKTEQKRFVEKFDALSIESQKLQEIYLKKLADLEELKKSILQKAFAGELKTEKAVAV